MEHVPALLIAVPLVGAALGRLPRFARLEGLEDAITILGCATVTGLALWVLPSAAAEPFVHWVGGWEPREGLVIGVPLVADGVAIGMIALAGLLTTAVAVYIVAGYQRLGGLFHVLMLLLLAAANGFVLAGDLLSMFVFIELLGITTYALTAYKVDDIAPVPAAFNIAVTSTVGAVIFLAGVTAVYGTVGTPNLAEASLRLGDVAGGPALVVACGLLVAGLSAKAGLVPFHFSHADAHAAAMAPLAGVFGAISVPVGLYGIARLLTSVVDPLGQVVDHARTVLLVAALTTALVGGIMAVVQSHLKRLLAFSSVAHLGIAAVGVAVATPAAMTGSLLYVLGHGPLKVALFLAAGAILHHLGSVDVTELAGRWREVRGPVVVLAVGAPLLAGTPPGGLYLAKSALETGAEDLGLGWIMIGVYLAAILTGAALVKGVLHLVLGWPAGPDAFGAVVEGERETTGHRASTAVLLLGVPAVLLTLHLGLALVPGLPAGAAAAAEHLLDPEAYATLVVHGEVTTAGMGSVPTLVTAASVAKGVLAGVAAVVLGVAAAHDRPGTQRTRMGTPLRLLRVTHSGHVGDYVSWASVGTAVWSVALLVTVVR